MCVQPRNLNCKTDVFWATIDDRVMSKPRGSGDRTVASHWDLRLEVAPYIDFCHLLDMIVLVWCVFVRQGLARVHPVCARPLGWPHIYNNYTTSAMCVEALTQRSRSLPIYCPRHILRPFLTWLPAATTTKTQHKVHKEVKIFGYISKDIVFASLAQNSVCLVRSPFVLNLFIYSYSHQSYTHIH